MAKISSAFSKVVVTFSVLLCFIMIIAFCIGAFLLSGSLSATDPNSPYNETHEPSETLNYLIELIGWTYFLSWSISMYPQVFLNYNRQSVEGLNFDFLLLNIIGHSSYMVYNSAFYYSNGVQEEYFKIHQGGVNPVLLNDVFFSVHASGITAYTIYQCFIYDRAGQTVSTMCGTIASLLIGFLGFSGFLTLTGFINVLEYAYCFSYVKLFVTFSKYMPQAVMNYKRKSTQGWSIENVLLDFLGGVLSVAQMFVLAYNFSDWSSISGSPTKLGLGLVTMIYDIVFMVQHYILYSDKI